MTYYTLECTHAARTRHKKNEHAMTHSILFLGNFVGRRLRWRDLLGKIPKRYAIGQTRKACVCRQIHETIHENANVNERTFMQTSSGESRNNLGHQTMRPAVAAHKSLPCGGLLSWHVTDM